MKMSSLAKQSGPISHLKKVWTFQRVTGVVKEEDLLRADFTDCMLEKEELEAEPGVAHRAETPITSENCPAAPESPRTDPMPSPPPQIYECKIHKFQYLRPAFAGRDLPIVMVSCYDPAKPKNKICCYGGRNAVGERCFLKDWE